MDADDQAEHSSPQRSWSDQTSALRREQHRLSTLSPLQDRAPTIKRRPMPPAYASATSTISFRPAPLAFTRWPLRQLVSRRPRLRPTARCFVLLVLTLVALALLATSPADYWRRKVVHIDITSISSKLQSLHRQAIPKSRVSSTSRSWSQSKARHRDYQAKVKKGWWGTVVEIPHLSTRPRAALVSLVRNSELDGILESMRQLEYRWNRNYLYPWVFVNDEPFSESFKASTRNLTSATCFYETIPPEHWSVPEWIDQNRFMNSLEYLGTIGVGKGWMTSYRHMCRWNSGFFYRLPRLEQFDWYWRVEPGVNFLCDIPYDPFRFMRDNELLYGFNMAILDDARSFPSLWQRTQAFVAEHPEYIHPNADPAWLLDPATLAQDYNNCQFFSNFELGSLSFFRSKAYQAYFDWLDQSGGFFYERFGDAPIHTLAISLFAPKDKSWFFRDIGYEHDINRHCPPADPIETLFDQRHGNNDSDSRNKNALCDCEPSTLDENFYKLVPLDSPQRKPDDTCIRLWLGGKWLEKRDGWSMQAAQAYGTGEYDGYKLSGLDSLE